ncbi:sulfurtransferase TusA family protein [Planococcus shixiaomingii]|uniref:sulfurtransferase TusA family protein n=1 Tax=Planococcus shixiaomingii TaxID=3058393 RepID=UPI00261A12C9|nr:sulfurtransferase TusA family protein [Planococcus sp. N022]WKA54533.1 sulfurtransferase TusA family protein [Planococcus sp. N022]
MIQTDKFLDAKGLACPMPIIKTKKALKDMEPGQVIEVQATDKGSLADLKAWAKSSGNQYLGTFEEGEVLKHYLRKADQSEEKEGKRFPHTVTNVELQERLGHNDVIVLDVREPAEYAFGHIEGAVSIPLGELENRLEELDSKKEAIVICRTGNRSDFAAKQLAEKGFERVKNAVQGMTEWNGPLEKNEV